MVLLLWLRHLLVTLLTAIVFKLHCEEFGSHSELNEYKHSFVSVFDKHLCHLYEIISYITNSKWKLQFLAINSEQC